MARHARFERYHRCHGPCHHGKRADEVLLVQFDKIDAAQLGLPDPGFKYEAAERTPIGSVAREQVGMAKFITRSFHGAKGSSDGLSADHGVVGSGVEHHDFWRKLGCRRTEVMRGRGGQESLGGAHGLMMTALAGAGNPSRSAR